MTSNAQAVENFGARWKPSGGGERSNCRMFLVELCRLLDVGEPEPAVEDESRNAYVFERKVADVLRTLALLGQAERVEDAYFLSE